MSITDLSREGGISGFDIDCDTCGQSTFFDRTYFQDFISDAKEAGWKIYKDNGGEWAHSCPACAEASQ